MLLGPPEACHAVRKALGARSLSGRGNLLGAAAPDGGCRLCDDVLDGGGVLVEIPEAVRDAGQVTELATFLRGLRDAHCVVIACGDDPPREAKAGAADTLGLLAEFYGAALPVFLAVVAPEDMAEGVAAPHRARALERLRGVGAEVLAVGYGDPELGARLAGRFRHLGAVACEPLRGSSPLLAQYRAIRQSLGNRRSSPSQRRQSAGGPTPPGGVSPPSPGAQAMPASSASPSGTPGSARLSPAGAREAGGLSPAGGLREAGGLRMSRKSRWTVMVFGKTGAGKSHLANLLCGYGAFASGDSVASVTNTESVRKAASKDDSVLVLDTIGFGDTRLPPDSVVRSLRDTALEAPGGIDALLFVLKKERVTTAEQETLGYVTEDLFGKECLPNLYMVITHAGRLAKEVELREPWLKEQAEASVPFGAMLQKLGPSPVERIAFVENSDPADAEDEEDRVLAERRRQRALADVQAILERHEAPAYQHGIMHRAGEIQAVRLEEMRRDLRHRIESEVRQDLQREMAGMLEEERQKMKEEAETLKERETEMQQRFEDEWTRMREEFETRARELARADLEPLAQEIVERTEKKSKNRRCSVM